MPIREIRWQNFRPFRDTGWLEIRPITVIIGANNSGKTSILDPLLLLKQTLRSKRAQSALVLRGDFVNAGSFSDIAYQHENTNMVTLGIRYHRRPRPQLELPELGESAPSVCEVTFRATPAAGVVALYRYAVLDQFDRPLVVRTVRTGQRYTLTGLQRWASEPADEEIRDDVSDQAARQAILESRPNHFLFDVDSIWNAALNAAAHSSEETEVGERLGEAEPIRLSSFVIKYNSVIDFTYDNIRDSLEDLFFLGPIREDPKRLYQISGDAPPDVGVRGEFSPELLLRGRRKALFRQVNTWLRRFDLPGRLGFEESIDNTFKLVLSRPDIPSTNFADVGFGFSQLLPLIVQGLSAPKDSLLMAEQPEIHLNPRLQARLGEFFLEVNKRGASVLLETHSEHLILGIRRLIAEQRLESANVAVYFVEATEAGSTVRRVDIQPNGHIELDDWPKGFFEDSLREAFAIAAAQARRRDAG
jgi:predicted ATPase